MGIVTWIRNALRRRRPVPVHPPIVPPPAVPPDPMPPAISASLLSLHNRLRAQAHAPALSLSSALGMAAWRHAAWMAVNRNVGHVEIPGSLGFTGISLSDRMVAAGYYGFAAAGENAAAGQATPLDVVVAWEASPAHLDNILSRFYRDVGFGTATDVDGVVYWCAVFASPGPGTAKDWWVSAPAAVIR